MVTAHQLLLEGRRGGGGAGGGSKELQSCMQKL